MVKLVNILHSTERTFAPLYTPESIDQTVDGIWLNSVYDNESKYFPLGSLEFNNRVFKIL